MVSQMLRVLCTCMRFAPGRNPLLPLFSAARVPHLHALRSRSQPAPSSLLCCACSTLACFRCSPSAHRVLSILRHSQVSLFRLGSNSLSADTSPGKAFGTFAQGRTFLHAAGPSVGDMFKTQIPDARGPDADPQFSQILEILQMHPV